MSASTEHTRLQPQLKILRIHTSGCNNSDGGAGTAAFIYLFVCLIPFFSSRCFSCHACQKVNIFNEEQSSQSLSWLFPAPTEDDSPSHYDMPPSRTTVVQLQTSEKARNLFPFSLMSPFIGSFQLWGCCKDAIDPCNVPSTKKHAYLACSHVDAVH